MCPSFQGSVVHNKKYMRIIVSYSKHVYKYINIVSRKYVYFAINMFTINIFTLPTTSCLSGEDVTSPLKVSYGKGKAC